MGRIFAIPQERSAMSGARLICVDGSILPCGESGIVFPLDGAELRVGRGDHCDLRLLVRQVSRYHARLFQAGGGWGVEDLGSTNGVFVNGRRLSAGWLRNGDDIRFGPVAFRYAECVSGQSDGANPVAMRTALDVHPYAPGVRRDPGLLVIDPAAGRRSILIQAGMRAGYSLLFGHGPSLGQDLRAFDPQAIVLDLAQRGVADLDALLAAIAEFSADLPILPLLGSDRAAEVLRKTAAAVGLSVVEGLHTPIDPDATYAAVQQLPEAKRPVGRRERREGEACRKLAVHFMPRIEIETGRVVGAEAVLGPHGNRDGEPPGSLELPAERDAELGFEVLGAVHQITELLRELAVRRPDFVVSCDLPGLCLAEDGFADRLVAMVDGSGVDPARIVLGIDDVPAWLKSVAGRSALRRFRQFGFRLSTGELRIGQSTDDEWHPGAVTELKLDRRLIAKLLDDRHTDRILRTAIGAARQLGLKTVAAGVDSPALLNRLRVIGCDQAQGYLVGRPMTRAEFHGWLAAPSQAHPGLDRCAPCRPAEACCAPCRPADIRGRRREDALDVTAVQARLDDHAPLRSSAEPAIAEFLAVVSHELRTPLNAILGFSEIMESELFGPLGNVRYRDYASDIRASGSQLHQIVNNLLDLYESERVRDDESMVPVRELVAACLKAAEPQAKRRGVRLESDVAPGTPGLWADEVRLRQILITLVGNAVKSAPNGGRVTAGARRTKEGGVALWVADTSDDQHKTPAQEVLLPCCDGASGCPKRTGRAGMNLPLTKALAQAHGAELHVDEAPGGGATATVTFPADRIDPARAAFTL